MQSNHFFKNNLFFIFFINKLLNIDKKKKSIMSLAEEPLIYVWAYQILPTILDSIWNIDFFFFLKKKL